jgi:hypothetical protein
LALTGADCPLHPRNLPLIVGTKHGLGGPAAKLVNDCSRRRRTDRTDPKGALIA